MTRQTNQACLTAHLVAECQHDTASTLATVHPDCVFVDGPLGLRFEGHDGARRHYEMWWPAFDDTVDGGRVHWVNDDVVIGEATFIGRHVGPFAGLAPTRQPIRLPIVVFANFRDGLLAGERLVYDRNGMLRQLGQPASEPAHA